MTGLNGCRARIRPLPLLLSAAVALTGAIAARPASARTIANNTPAAIRQSQDLGPAAASGSMTVTLWLQAPNADAAAELAVRQL